MNKAIRMILSICAAVFTFSYVGVMIYRYNYTPYKTETAYIYSMNDSITAKAAFLRSEVIIPPVGGVLRYKAQGGEVVLKGNEVADVYASDDDIEQHNEITVLNQEISNLKAAQSSVYSGINTISVMNSQVEEQLRILTLSAAYGRLDNIKELTQNVTYNINRKQVAVGYVSDFTERIDYLSSESDYLTRNVKQAVGTVIAPVAGYFSPKTDGYETLFSIESLDNINDEAVADLIAGRLEPSDSSGSGKIVTAHNYYVAITVDAETAERFNKVSPFATVTLNFPSDTAQNIDADISAVRELENGSYIVYFSVSNINNYLLSQRTANALINIDTVSGIRLPNSAVRYIGSQAGVYVLINGRILFKPIKIIYEETGYILCNPAESTDTSPLKMYDQVIIAGTDLYDGKIVG